VPTEPEEAWDDESNKMVVHQHATVGHHVAVIEALRR